MKVDPLLPLQQLLLRFKTNKTTFLHHGVFGGHNEALGNLTSSGRLGPSGRGRKLHSLPCQQPCSSRRTQQSSQSVLLSALILCVDSVPSDDKNREREVVNTESPAG